MANKIIQLTDAGGNNIYPMAYAQGGMKIDLLWTNPSPTTAFTAQTVNVNLSDYAMVLIEGTTVYSGSNPQNNSTICKIGDRANLYTAWGTVSASRMFTVNSSGIVFENAWATTSTTTQQNGMGVPNKIYGIKASYIVPTEVHGLTYIDDDTSGNITLKNNDGTKALYPHSQIVCLDETKVLASGNLSQVFGGSYKTTEDCFVLCQCAGHTLIVDGVVVLPYFSTVGGPQSIIPLKKGKTITSSSPIAVNIIAYGVKH